MTRRQAFRRHAALIGAASVVGFAVALWLPMSESARTGALLGVGGAALSSAIALPLKRRAVARSLKAAMVAMGVVFGLRLVLVAVGLALVLLSDRLRDAGPGPFIGGFFGLYFASQWLEISYVAAATSAGGSGRK